MVAQDTIDDITFLSNNYDLGINLNTKNNKNVNIKKVTSTPSIFNSQTSNNNIEFAGLDKELGDNFGWHGAGIAGTLTFAGQVVPEIAKQYYQEDKNIFTMDYKKIYDKIDFVDIGAMAVVGMYTPNELSAGKSAKNIIDAAAKYKKYSNLADKTNKNLNKKTRFDNKAIDNENTVVREIGVQTFIFAGKELLKESNDIEEKENE